MGNYYVENDLLLIEIEEYKISGVISEKLGKMILMIAKNYANRGNFSNYTWKEDMIGDAILICCKYIHNFKPEKQDKPNPFAYITTICHNAFVNFIRKQKKHSEIKDTCYKGFKESIDRKLDTDKAIDYEEILIK